MWHGICSIVGTIMDDITKTNALTLADIPFEPLSLLIGAIAGMLIAGLIFFWWSRQFKGLRSQNSVLNDRQAQQDQQFDKIEHEKRIISEKLELSQVELARTQAEKTSLVEQMNTRKEDEKLFEKQFENLAHKIFDDKSTKFKQVNQESLGHLLNPLQDKLKDFEKKVNDSFGKQANEQFALNEQIKSIVQANDKITLQAENLTNALKGDSKTQGDWGEIILESILNNAGLVKDVNYITQGAGMGMKHVETGQALKPDVIVKLPDDKHVIIDSKVSLTHYERWNSEQDEAAKAIHLKQFLASVRQHVKDLEKRKYQSTDQVTGTPDFVLMFLPIEYAYMVALQHDRDLHSFAWDKGVTIVCPSTLFGSLKTISSLWRLVLQNQNAIEIAKKGGQLYDKIAGFVGDMEVIGKNLNTLEGNYSNAMKKLSSGTGHILKRTEELKELGAKATKSLPSALIADEIEESTLLEANSNKVA